MNILHLLSQNHLTGAEVYAAQLIEEHHKAGVHSIYQISNDFFSQTKAKQIKLAVETKSKIQFWKNVFWLRRFLIENKIHVIHTHSRAAAKLAFWARFRLNVGLVSTVHGRQHPSISKRIWNHYGDFIICVCENIQHQLLKDFKYNQRRLSVIRNAVCEDLFQFTKNKITLDKNRTLKIAVVGRTTGPKGLRTKLVLEGLNKILTADNIKAEYTLVGASNAAITLGLSPEIKVKQIHVETLTTADYEKYDLVVGSGRVAIESLLSGIPTLCFGEASYLGLTRLHNCMRFLKSNFGDIEIDSTSPKLHENQLKKDIADLFNPDFTENERLQITDVIQNEFNSVKISKQIYRLYESSYFLRNYSKWIPILMYHKIPNTEIESKHKIFVTKENFKKHLQFFKNTGFETLTFNDLKKFKSAELDFSHFPKKPLLLTFDDGYVDNLENASPLLKEFNFKAQLFLLANSDVNSNYWDHSKTEPSHPIVSGADRKKWLTSAFEVGSHGLSHKRITEMTEAEARHELAESKRLLENELQQPISVYAFTYGDTNESTAKWAFEEGYDFAVNTDTGGLILEENPYQIFRVNIFPNETTSTLKKKTSTWYRKYYYLKRKK